MTHPFPILLARLGLGLMWIVAGASKLGPAGTRSEAVARFGLLPPAAATVVGRALPGIEVALGLLLLVGFWMIPAAAASAGLLVVFSLAIIVDLIRGRRIECHCFGQMGHAPISWWSVARNAALLAAAMVLALRHPDYLAADGWRRGIALRPTDPPALEFVPVLLIALAGLALWAILVSAWEVARAAARAEGGPALGMPERRFLRRRLRLATSRAAAGGGATAEDGR